MLQLSQGRRGVAISGARRVVTDVDVLFGSQYLEVQGPTNREPRISVYFGVLIECRDVFYGINAHSVPIDTETAVLLFSSVI